MGIVRNLLTEDENLFVEYSKPWARKLRAKMPILLFVAPQWGVFTSSSLKTHTAAPDGK